MIKSWQLIVLLALTSVKSFPSDYESNSIDGIDNDEYSDLNFSDDFDIDDDNDTLSNATYVSIREILVIA